MRHPTRRVPILLAAAIVLTLAGCSSLPTDPLTARSPGASPSSLGIDDGAGGTTPVTTTTTDVVAATSSKLIVGLFGGSVHAGDFTVVVPPLAITGDATITVQQPDVTQPYVRLSISPASANKFNLPVLLIANAQKVNPALLSTTTIDWLDPATGLWVTVPGCTVDVSSLTVQAPLWHFSDYRVSNDGKAGW